MMTTKMMKRTAIAAIVGAMSYGAAGVAEVSAHALSVPEQRASYTSFDGRDDVQQLAWKSRRDRDRDRWERDRDRRDRCDHCEEHMSCPVRQSTQSHGNGCFFIQQ